VAIQLDSSDAVKWAQLYRSGRCCQSVILEFLRRKFYLNTNSAAAQCHWSYRTICCFRMTDWQTSDPEKPAVWWPHWPEILCTIPTVKTARTLGLCFVFRYCMQYSATGEVWMFQVMYRLRNRPIQCQVQNACHISQT